MNAAATQWLQHTHLDKLYGHLPGMRAALPAVFGLTEAEYAEVVAGFDRRAAAAAADLLADAEVAAQVDAVDLAPGAVLLAVGDSITDDLQSWFEILRHLLDLRRPGHGIRLVNGGLSAHTSAMILRRWPGTLAATGPDLVVCALGGNDVTRVGPEPTRTVVSLDESVANLAELRRIAAAGPDPAWLWLTPAPVVEERVAAHPAFRFGPSTWRNADVSALAERMRGFADPVVDLTAVLGGEIDDLQGADGVHPDIDGQAAIARAVLAPIAALTRRVPSILPR